MKAVLRSIKPYWLYLILIGEKTVEVGKDFPKAEVWNKEVNLYCSKDKKSFDRIPEKDREWMRKYLGKCACRFVCNKIEDLRYDALEMTYFSRKYRDTKLLDEEFFPGTQVTYQEAYDYCKGMSYGEEDSDLFYGWHISDLKIYDKPRELSEFKRECNHVCVDTKTKKKCERILVDGFSCNGLKSIKRPPQSWTYVEVEE